MKKGMIAILLSMAMLVSAIPMMGSAADTEQPEVPEPIEGTTDMLGGGGYVHIKFGDNSEFGVIYGTEENPNSIIIVAKVVKYIGSVEAYDTNGAKIGERMVKVGMLYAQKLDTLVEFNDSNENGIFDYRGIFPYDDILTHEPVYKRVSLKTAWEPSEIEKTVEGDNTTWTFTLTAHNLTYIPVGESETVEEQVANETLETLQFTFHLRAENIYVDNAGMPHFRLTMEVREGMMGNEIYRVTKVDRSHENVTGWKTSYGVKYDQYIEGWDFDPSNENPSLLLVFHSIFGHYVPIGEALWIRHALRNIGANGTARYYTESGEEQVNDTSAVDEQSGAVFKARKLRHRFIEIDDSWERVARFTWVSNVTVDGEDKQMYAQIQCGIRHTVIARGQVFTGFALIGGLVYPGGNQIYHDPEVSGEALIELGSAPSNNPPRVGILIIALAGTAIIVGAAYYLHKKKKSREFEDLAESALPEEKRY